MLYVNPIDLQTNRLQNGPEDPAKRKVALREMEHSFLFTLLQEMRKTIDTGTPGKASQEKQTYDEMLDDALAKEMAQSGQMGLARQMEQQMALQQENPRRAQRG